MTEKRVIALCSAAMDTEQDQDWQTFKTSVSSRTAHLLDSSLYSDATLSVGVHCRTEFKVHKNILAMSSPVFEAMFFGALAENSSVHIPDIQSATFERLLTYIYKDKLDIPTIIDAWDLWYAANKYLLKHLADRCLEYIGERMTDYYVLYSLEKAIEYNLEQVEARCLRHIDINAESVLKSRHPSQQIHDFLHISKECVMKILGRPLLTATEVDIFKAVKEWGTTSLQRDDLPLTPESLRERISSFLPLIRFSNMTPDDFLEWVVPTGILPIEQLNECLLVLLRRLVPTHHEETFRKYALQLVCERGTLYTRCSHFEAADHFLQFKVYTSLPSCLLTGLRVARAHLDSPCMICQQEKYLRHLHNDSEEEDENGGGGNTQRLALTCAVIDYSDRQLAYFDGVLSTADYVVDFATPVPLQSGSLYTFHLKLHHPISLSCCQSNCKQKVNMGDVQVEFFSDLRSRGTTINLGLISHLFFYAPGSTDVGNNDDSGSRPLDLKLSGDKGESRVKRVRFK